MSVRPKKLPINVLERIDDRCAEFERRWLAGDSPDLEGVISEDIVGDEREVLLAELIALDLDYRRRRGDKPTKEEYLDRLPQFRTVIEDAFVEQDKPSGSFTPPTVEHLSEIFPALEIQEFLGAGGMGAVYKARQEGLDRVVALKVLPEELGRDVKFALRFTREARTLARLNHPNIVSVYEFGHTQDAYYFLMEFVDGLTLRDLVCRGGLKPEQALALVPSLCDALQFAHEKGVIHRDIKPENILLAKDGTVKIADFGLSRIVGGENPATMLTGTHQVMGTPRYMAPEQMAGARNIDHRADIYSLGVVIYEMLTGELPVGRFELPSRKVAVDVRLDDVVLRALEKEPERRYQYASEIKTDVQSIASSEDPASVRTVIGQADRSEAGQPATTSLHEQELASRLLVTRRQLMDRVRDALRPLFRWQLLQVLVGIALIGVGAQCWARNTDVAHRVVNGGIVHVYGIVLIGCAVAVCTRIKRIDYSKPVGEVRAGLETVKRTYLRVSPAIGFPWWLMWIPVAVTLGFEQILYRNALVPSLIVGVLGTIASIWLYVAVIRSSSPKAEQWKQSMVGSSIRSADLALAEIEQTKIS